MNKVERIIVKFPQLTGHEDLVSFVIEIREVFKLEKVPFEIKVKNWSSGSLDAYYRVQDHKKESLRKSKKEKLKNARRKKGSTGWKRF